MPQVGKKHFGYDKAGQRAAQREAAKTGVPMKGMPMPPPLTNAPPKKKPAKGGRR